MLDVDAAIAVIEPLRGAIGLVSILVGDPSPQDERTLPRDDDEESGRSGH